MPFRLFTVLPATMLMADRWRKSSSIAVRSDGCACTAALEAVSNPCTACSARLRHDDLLPADVEKHFEVNPLVQTRPVSAKTTVTSISPAKPTLPIDASVPPSDMRRCSLVELDDGQCRWPLGDVHQVATQFCGGDAVPGRCYCAHHLQRASSRHA